MRLDDIDSSLVTLDMLPEEGQEIANIIGIPNYLNLVMEFGGRSVYIHKLDSVIRLVRDEKIRKDFNGDNHAFLCKKHNLSEKQIRLILSANRNKQISIVECSNNT
jgi:Mor family transcriptional regulator